jgi:ribosomal protein S18 acetylase RimI-like enzyme
MNDAALYARGIRTLVASWEAVARGSNGAAVQHFHGGSAAVFPVDPERRIYNNAVVDRALTPVERGRALTAVEASYAAVGVERFTVWAHERDEDLQADLERRGYTLSDSTRAMAMTLDDIRVPRPEVDLAPAEWQEHLRLIGAPPGLLSGADLSAFHLVVAGLDGESVSTVVAFDHDGDCGIYDVATLEQARNRGLATALTALQLHEALARGCRTASVQSTPMGESVYAAVGFRDFGRIHEYAPAGLSW